MTDHILLIRLLPIPVILVVFIVYVVIPRMRMKRRAKALLAQMPQHERKTVYVAFDSAWPPRRRKQREAKTIDEERSGWTYLKASAANFSKTNLTWGGGINLHFIRKP